MAIVLHTGHTEALRCQLTVKLGPYRTGSLAGWIPASLNPPRYSYHYGRGTGILICTPLLRYFYHKKPDKFVSPNPKDRTTYCSSSEGSTHYCDLALNLDQGWTRNSPFRNRHTRSSLSSVKRRNYSSDIDLMDLAKTNEEYLNEGKRTSFSSK